MNPDSRTAKLFSIQRVFSHLGHHVRPHWRALLLGGICILGVSVTELLRPWPIKIIFDVILSPKPNEEFLDHIPLLGGSTEILLAAISLSILLISIMKGLFGFGQKILIKSVGAKVAAAIRQQLHRHIHRLSRSFHDSHSSGDIIIRLTSDIRRVQGLMVGVVALLSENLLVLLGMVAIMFWMDWQLTLVSLVIFPPLIFLNMHFLGKIKGTAKKQRRRESQIANIISETISSITLVQAFTREQHEDKRFSRKNRSNLRAGLKTARLTEKHAQLIEILIAAGICAVIWIGVKKVIAEVLTPGDLLVFVAYLKRLYRPIRRLARLTSRIAKAGACGERIISILEKEPEIKDAPDAIVASPFRGEIVFQGVDFCYHLGDRILKDVNFTLKPGQMGVLHGPSGAGKSTIANLLLRLNDPQKGRILIDGTDIRRYTLASLRDQIAFVFQEAVLFNTTIRENITYGKLDATEEEIVAVAKAANAHDFIQELQNGYETVIGERGGALSGGEKRRISIARALIRNAPILILDEPMTGLDAGSEAKVHEALKSLISGRTCLLITHDLQAVAEADLVLSLEEGRIVEHGKHSNLVANG